MTNSGRISLLFASFDCPIVGLPSHLANVVAKLGDQHHIELFYHLHKRQLVPFLCIRFALTQQQESTND